MRRNAIVISGLHLKSAASKTLVADFAGRYQGLGFRGLGSLPRPPNYPLTYPKYPLLRAMRAPLKGPWGVLVGFRV